MLMLQILLLWITLQLADMQELEEQLAVDRNTVREHLHFLSRSRMIERTSYGYRKSPTFIAILRRRQAATSQTNFFP